MAVTAGLFKNPISQIYLSKVVPHLNICFVNPTPMGRIMNSAMKSMVHFFTMGSLANAAVLLMPAFLKNMDPNEGFNNLVTKFEPSMKVGALFWPPIHFLNYHFSPLHYRQLVIDLSSFFFAIYLSYLCNKSI